MVWITWRMIDYLLYTFFSTFKACVQLCVKMLPVETLKQQKTVKLFFFLQDYRKYISSSIARNGKSKSYTVAIDNNPPMNFMTDVGSTKEAADDPWKSGLPRWVLVITYSNSLFFLVKCFTHLCWRIKQKR